MSTTWFHRYLIFIFIPNSSHGEGCTGGQSMPLREVCGHQVPGWKVKWSFIRWLWHTSGMTVANAVTCQRHHDYSKRVHHPVLGTPSRAKSSVFLTLFKPGGGIKPMFKNFCCRFCFSLGPIWRYNPQCNPQHKCSKMRGGGGGSKAVWTMFKKQTIWSCGLSLML